MRDYEFIGLVGSFSFFVSYFGIAWRRKLVFVFAPCALGTGICGFMWGSTPALIGLFMAMGVIGGWVSAGE
jgi:hypothetical protein